MFKHLKRGLLACLLFSGAAYADLPKDYQVILLTENFPPFNMADEGKNFARDESIKGIGTDIVREMFKRADIQYNLTLRFPWDRIYKLTQEKPSYGLFTTSYTEERKAQFKWVGPIAKTRWVLFAAPGSSIKLNSLQDAANYSIGAYKNDAISQYLQKEGLTLVNALRGQENVKKLVRGQVDLWATTDSVGIYQAKQEGVTGLNVVLGINEVDQYLALNKDTPDEVVQRLQKALDAMRAEGVVDKITNSYL